MNVFRYFFVLSLLFCAHSSIGQTLPTYKIYSKTGKAVNYGKMMKTLNKAELIFVGELHNNPLSHWLEVKLIKSIHQSGDVVIGMEMFETDTQAALNKYLNGDTEQKNFERDARIWSNYTTDYAPIVAYAKASKLPVIATNIPRQYANMVYKNGFEVVEDLVDEEQQWIAPLPIPYDASLPGYQAMLDMVEGHGGENFPKAQAIKDATMGNNIVKNWPSSGRFIHLNGAYHSNNFEGILWYVDQYRPGTKMATVATVTQANINALASEHLGTADFILVIDEDVTKSY